MSQTYCDKPVPFFQVDAFTASAFKGNPAAVMVLPAWLDDDILLAIAAENNLSETAFLVPVGDDYELRWFTPAQEVPLCGHATLAAAHVVLNCLKPQSDIVHFISRERGVLPVKKDETGRLVMNFPVTPLRRVVIPEKLDMLLGAEVLEVQGYLSGEYLAVLPSAKAVRALTPHLQHFDKVKAKGIIVTAQADEADDCDFVCRYFAPGLGVPEDPVTGSIHTALVPFWAKRLGQDTLISHQVSKRHGVLYCTLDGDRVHIAGDSVLFIQGEAIL